jgi:hypothetical protein
MNSTLALPQTPKPLELDQNRIIIKLMKAIFASALLIAATVAEKS